MSTREGCRCQASEGTYHGAPLGAHDSKSRTAFNILLESYPCSACDEMRLGHLRFLMETGLTKAQGRPDSAAAEVWHIGKAREDLFPCCWSRSLHRRPQKFFAALPALDQRRDAAALMQIAGNRGDMRCESHRSSAPDLGPGACRTPEQEHRRRSRHQPAQGRKPSRGNHEEDGSRSLLALIRTAIAAA
jgi:hypothetical protein